MTSRKDCEPKTFTFYTIFYWAALFFTAIAWVCDPDATIRSCLRRTEDLRKKRYGEVTVKRPVSP